MFDFFCVCTLSVEPIYSLFREILADDRNRPTNFRQKGDFFFVKGNARSQTIYGGVLEGRGSVTLNHFNFLFKSLSFERKINVIPQGMFYRHRYNE